MISFFRGISAAFTAATGKEPYLLGLRDRRAAFSPSLIDAGPDTGGGLGQAKSNLTIKWHAVPHEWLSDNDQYLYPTKIIERLGMLNDAEFLGLAKGTCLLNAAQFDPVLYPVAPADPAEPLGGWDVTLSLEHFDPTKGVPASEYRGHRVFPYRVDGKWYFANRENNTDELLPLTDMYKVFQHWADAS